MTDSQRLDFAKVTTPLLAVSRPAQEESYYSYRRRVTAGPGRLLSIALSHPGYRSKHTEMSLDELTDSFDVSLDAMRAAMTRLDAMPWEHE